MMDKIQNSLALYGDGVLTRGELLIHVGLDLAESGTRSDITELPEWLQKDLDNWAQEFEVTQQWLLLSNAGQRDVTAFGKKLLALIRSV